MVGVNVPGVMAQRRRDDNEPEFVGWDGCTFCIVLCGGGVDGGDGRKTLTNRLGNRFSESRIIFRRQRIVGGGFGNGGGGLYRWVNGTWRAGVVDCVVENRKTRHSCTRQHSHGQRSNDKFHKIIFHRFIC